MIYLEENFKKIFSKNIYVINKIKFQTENILLNLKKIKYLLFLSSKKMNIF